MNFFTADSETFGHRERTDRRMGIRLLPRDALIRTGDVDHAAWNYGGLLGYVSRRRFALVRALLPDRPIRKLLEIGYGSGVFLPTLGTVAQEVYGADIHGHGDEVRAILNRHGVNATLVQAPAESLPFADRTFDVVVAISTFEFVRDVRVAIDELARVLTDDGRIIVVTPGSGPVLDLALRIATGESAQADFGDRRDRIVPTLREAMQVERVRCFPGTPGFTVYRALRLAKRMV